MDRNHALLWHSYVFATEFRVELEVKVEVEVEVEIKVEVGGRGRERSTFSSGRSTFWRGRCTRLNDVTSLWHLRCGCMVFPARSM